MIYILTRCFNVHGFPIKAVSIVIAAYFRTLVSKSNVAAFRRYFPPDFPHMRQLMVSCVTDSNLSSSFSNFTSCDCWGRLRRLVFAGLGACLCLDLARITFWLSTLFLHFLCQRTSLHFKILVTSATSLQPPSPPTGTKTLSTAICFGNSPKSINACTLSTRFCKVASSSSGCFFKRVLLDGFINGSAVTVWQRKQSFQFRVSMAEFRVV